MAAAFSTLVLLSAAVVFGGAAWLGFSGLSFFLDDTPALLANDDGALRPVLGTEQPSLPLASLPDTTVVSCNETGRWLVYRSDAHGFHNPPAAWTAAPPRLMLAGDSFAHGSCVESDANMAGRLCRYLDARLEEAMARFDNPRQDLLDFLQLFHLRERFGLGPLSLGVVPADLDDQISYFDTVAERVRDEVAGWNGRLVIAYLPESARYFAAAHNGEIRSHIRDAVLRTAKRHAIPLVDLTATFDRAPDPGRLFVYPGSHYSADGYALAADAIAAAVKALPAAPDR